ncbi:zinc finger protein 62-like [Aricia agestis]|uniref:zinc finger protein 62-like n=1 Tax=Aricia agestis TaxID=91739 RepID=UPI001C202611|nr:zinc finger protein 62-like [Aricia agestis]
MTDAELNRSAIKFICGDIDNVCRLCLNIIGPESSKISIYQIAIIQTPYYNDELSYHSVFQELGVTSEPALPGFLCVSCATLSVNAFLFQKLCECSEQQWKTSFNLLEKFFTQSETLNTRAVSVFFNVEENEMLTSYNPMPVKNKKYVVAKLQRNMKIRKKRKNEKNIIQRRFPCQTCGKEFSKFYELETHKQQVHYPKTIGCDLCTKKFSTEKLLCKHKKTNHVSLSCYVCNQEYSSKNSLRTHMVKHTNNKQDTCPRCNKEFSNPQSYKFHLKNCGQYICDMCGKEYSQKCSLMFHLACTHGFSNNIRTCLWCDKKFLNASTLKQHEVKHTRERNFTCEICGGKFVTNRALIYHRRLHTGERPYPCDICGESFLNSSRRMMHKRRVHLGPDKECEICSAKFHSNTELQRHKRRHDNPHSKEYYVPKGNTKSGLKKGKVKVMVNYNEYY